MQDTNPIARLWHHDWLRLRNIIANQAYKYRTEPFTLKSGKKSHHYVDMRQVITTEAGLSLLGMLLTSSIRHEFPDANAVAGVELSAVPIAASVSFHSHLTRLVSVPYNANPLDMVIVRKAQKEHGTQKRVELYEPNRANAKIVVVEDVTTTGGSAMGAVDTLIEEGLDVLGVIVVVDRSEGEAMDAAEEWLYKGNPIHFVNIFTLHDIVAEYKEIQETLHQHRTGQCPLR